MAKFKAEKISYIEQDRLIKKLGRVLTELKTDDAITNFLKDLLNRQERMMLVRRLQIAELLAAGETYNAIIEKLNCGPTTIARIERWLNFGRGGFKKATKIT